MQKHTRKLQNPTMRTSVKNRLKVDFYGVHPRLVWANEREVEPEFLDGGMTRGATDTAVWFLISGEVTVTYPRATMRAKAGQWVFLRAENGRQRFTPGSRLISMRFHLRLRGGEQLFAPRRDLILPESECPRLKTAARALVAEFARVDALGTLWVARDRLSLVDNLRIEAAFMGWLSAYVDIMETLGETPATTGERDERVVKALTLIEEHQMRDKFSEVDLARQCGLSVNQLGRVFRRDQQMSPFQYYEKLRLELARHALAESTLPVKEIGFELGFGSSPHFSNWFAERTGTGPREYRTKHSAPVRKKK